MSKIRYKTEGEYFYGLDLGDRGDLAVEVKYKREGTKIIIVNSKIIGHSEDFEDVTYKKNWIKENGYKY